MCLHVSLLQVQRRTSMTLMRALAVGMIIVFLSVGTYQRLYGQALGGCWHEVPNPNGGPSGWFNGVPNQIPGGPNPRPQVGQKCTNFARCLPESDCTQIQTPCVGNQFAFRSVASFSLGACEAWPYTQCTICDDAPNAPRGANAAQWICAKITPHAGLIGNKCAGACRVIIYQ